MWVYVYAAFIVVCLSASSRSEIGSCPPTMSVDICEDTCNLSRPCNETQLCCPTMCGGSMCVDPMTKRLDTDLVKPGLCPEYPRGVWVCSNMCIGDSDCPRALKCCANRCGALTCQKPDPEPEPTTEAPAGFADTEVEENIVPDT